MKYSIVAIALLMVSLPFAFAEQATIDVPFKSHGLSCTFDEVAVEYHCVWQGSPSPMTLEELEEFEDVLTPEEYEEAVEELSKEPVVEPTIEVPVKEQTIVEKELERLIELCHGSSGCTYADEEVMKSLRTMNDVCELGIEEGLPIQTYRTFELPTNTPDTKFKSINLGNYHVLKDIMLKIEECSSWNEYRAKYLAQYLDIVVDTWTGEELHHSNHATESSYEYDPYFKAPVNPLDEHNIASQAICDHVLYSEKYKRQMGCPPTVFYEGDPSLAPEMKDYGNNLIWKQYQQFQNGDLSGQLHKNKMNSQNFADRVYGGND